MTNSIVAAISRFWLTVNAHAWRYCPETVQHRLNAAHATLSRELRELIRQQSDADFGRGWREGHEVGHLAGWDERDIEAQRELAQKNDQIQALMATLESYELRDDDPHAHSQVVAQVSHLTLSVNDPGAPVH
jgi:hypothetical protein